MSKIYNIKPFQYVHILDKNKNIMRLLEGPVNYAIEDHEVIVGEEIKDMIVIPNLYRVIITNPVERDEKGAIIKDTFGHPKNKWGYTEIRTREKWSRPFPLYPNEISTPIEQLEFVQKDHAVHFRAVLPFTDEDGEHKIGDEWYIIGNRYYSTRPEARKVREVNSFVLRNLDAYVLEAVRDFTKDKVSRAAGERWLVKEEGMHMESINEKSISSCPTEIIDDNHALHLKANNTFIDSYGNQRNAGDEYLITRDISNLHCYGVYEEIISLNKRVVLTCDEYVIIENPYNPLTRKNELGKLKQIEGESSFFLYPGEIMRPIQSVYVLTEQDALLLQAIESYKDDKNNKVVSGEKWMIKGPCRYVPPIEVRVLESRNVIPLDKTEGIYIRDIRTGNVKIHMGSSYLLDTYEILWEKHINSEIEEIYLKDQYLTSRDKSRVVTYKCPFNSVMQIYNLKEKTNRLVIGPNLVVLEPNEEFCLMKLSGGTPKVEGVVKTLYLKLGPCFSTDEFLVETSDHTRLILTIGYNWHFNIKSDKDAIKIFSVRDFIGDLCSNMASKIRSHIATITFEDFHKNSDLYIKKSVFGEEDGLIKKSIIFDDCNLEVNDVDIKAVVPSDPSTKKLLSKSVSLAIEFATKTIEQEFNIQAKIKSQEFKGELEKLRLNNNINYLQKQIELNKLKVISNIIEQTGLSRAQALAQKDADLIESKSAVEYSLKVKESNMIETDFEIEKTKKTYDNEFLEKSENQRLQLKKSQTLNSVETEKFQMIMEALGPETLVEIAKAGPELQAKLLQGLNLDGYILTDGNNPINLFNVAENLTTNKNN